MSKKTIENQTFVERIFESTLWSSRYVILTGVIFSILASICLFLIGSYEIIRYR